MTNAVTLYIKQNNLTKIDFVQDLTYVGVICLENGELFKILRTDAYNSIMGYSAGIKKKLMKLIIKRDTNEGFPFMYELFLTEKILKDSLL